MKTQKIITACLFFYCFLVLPDYLHSQAEVRLMPHYYKNFDKLVTDAMTAYGPNTGMAVGIVHRGKIAHVKSYGFADRANNRRVTNQTLFRWASVSKTITAVAALKMREEQKISFTRPIKTYYRGYNNNRTRNWADEITMHHLLTHTSGIDGNSNLSSWHSSRDLSPNWNDQLTTYYNLRPTTRIHREAMVNIFDDVPLFAKPGTRGRYTTYGYNLAGAVIDKKLNFYRDGYSNYIRKHIVEPLGMSSFHADFTGSRSNKAWGYNSDGSRVRNYELISHKIPGGGHVSNIVDMTKFVKGLANGEILSHHSYRLMHRRYTSNFGVDPYSYGYGVFVGTSKDVDFYFHTGDQPHARTIILYVPSKDMGVAIMCNNADFTFSRKIKLAQDLLKTIGGPF